MFHQAALEFSFLFLNGPGGRARHWRSGTSRSCQTKEAQRNATDRGTVLSTILLGWFQRQLGYQVLTMMVGGSSRMGGFLIPEVPGVGWSFVEVLGFAACQWDETGRTWVMFDPRQESRKFWNILAISSPLYPHYISSYPHDIPIVISMISEESWFMPANLSRLCLRCLFFQLASAEVPESRQACPSKRQIEHI